MKLRRLTSTGMQTLRSDLEAHKNHLPLIADYQNRYLSTEIRHGIEIDANRQFDSKYDAGKYFLDCFTVHQFPPDDNVWNFLSLVYYHQLLNRQGVIGEWQRMFLFRELNHHYPHTHLLKFPYDFCRVHRHRLEDVKFALADRLNNNSELYVVLARNSQLFRNPQYLSVMKQLFFDNQLEKWRPRSTNEQTGIYELNRIYKQYARAHDMHGVSPEQFCGMISAEHRRLFGIEEKKPTSSLKSRFRQGFRI